MSRAMLGLPTAFATSQAFVAFTLPCSYVAGQTSAGDVFFTKVHGVSRLRIPTGIGYVTLPAIAGIESDDTLELCV